ncbi:hypothetical protein BGX28_003544 [Mortierella sp. GBA30]|nr:hypothetical protein BGX28_003544 [Mortierella sp. GBA30]
MSFPDSRFFIYVFDCILYEHASQAKTGETLPFELVNLFNTFAHINNFYTLHKSLLSAPQEAQTFQRYGSTLYRPDFANDIPQQHLLFPLDAYKVHTSGVGAKCLLVPALSGDHQQSFVWRYARKVPATHQNDIAALIWYLRKNAWRHLGSSGPSVTIRPGLSGVRKYSRDHNQAKLENNREHSDVRLQQEHREEMERRLAQEQQQKQRSRNPSTATEDSGVDMSFYALAVSKSKLQCINNLMDLLRRTTVSTAAREAQISLFVSTIQHLLRDRFPEAALQLHITGSYASGLCAMSSDVDATLTGNILGITVTALSQVLRELKYEKIVPIPGAKVPIVTFWDRSKDIYCDISIDQRLAIHNSKLIKTYEAIDTRVQVVWFSLKHLAKKFKILSAKDGFLSSYALTMMLITYLQNTVPPVLPCLQQLPAKGLYPKTIDSYDCSFDENFAQHIEKAQENRETSSELLLGLLRFFGHQFDYKNQEVNPRLGKFRPQFANMTNRRWNKESFWVMDPFITDRNVAGMCRGANVHLIRFAFQDAYRSVIEEPNRILTVNTL